MCEWCIFTKACLTVFARAHECHVEASLTVFARAHECHAAHMGTLPHTGSKHAVDVRCVVVVLLLTGGPGCWELEPAAGFPLTMCLASRQHVSRSPVCVS